MVRNIGVKTVAQMPIQTAAEYSTATMRAETYGAPLISSHQAQNALCLYEAMLHQRDDCAALNERWGDVGSYEMRDAAILLAPLCDALWHKLDGEGAGNQCDGLAWDFEFLPKLLDFVDWKGCKLVPEAEGAMRTWLEAKQARNAAAAKWSMWQFSARSAAGRLWGYPDLVNDDPDALRAAYDAGDDAEGYILALGRELGLSEPDPLTQQTLNRQYPRR